MSKNANIIYNETIAKIHNKYENEIDFIDNLIYEASEKFEFNIKVYKPQINGFNFIAKHLKMYYISLGYSVKYFADVHHDQDPYIFISWNPKDTSESVYERIHTPTN